jgi:hypothetical protein
MRLQPNGVSAATAHASIVRATVRRPGATLARRAAAVSGKKLAPRFGDDFDRDDNSGMSLVLDRLLVTELSVIKLYH